MATGHSHQEATRKLWPGPRAAPGRGDLHEHRPQFQEVVVLRVLHLHDTPRVEAASDLLAFGFNQLIGSDHRERDAGLERDSQARRTPRGNPGAHGTHAEHLTAYYSKFTQRATGTPTTSDFTVAVASPVGQTA